MRIPTKGGDPIRTLRVLEPEDERAAVSIAQDLLVESTLAAKRGLKRSAASLADMSRRIRETFGVQVDWQAASDEAERRIGLG